MPRIIETTVYKLDELTPGARQKAIENVAAKLGGDWWDQSDNEDVEATMVYALAGKFHTPGWDTFGQGDFPGIDALTVRGWDIGRAQSLDLKGKLTRETAPALPWADGIERVFLGGLPDYGIDARIWVEWADGHAEITLADDDAEKALTEAVETAIRDAWQAGYDEAEYKSGTEYAGEWIESNEAEFTEDGELYR